MVLLKSGKCSIRISGVNCFFFFIKQSHNYYLQKEMLQMISENASFSVFFFLNLFCCFNLFSIYIFLFQIFRGFCLFEINRIFEIPKFEFEIYKFRRSYQFGCNFFQRFYSGYVFFFSLRHNR